MLTVYRSNRAEWLAKVLAEQLRLRPPGVCETIQIMVNTWPTSRWLGEEIALVNNINSLITFPFPGTHLRKIVHKILKIKGKREYEWNKDALVWAILEVLPELLLKQEAISLRNWLDNQLLTNGEVTRAEWQLAKNIANTFDDYFLYRPELTCQWWEFTENPEDSLKDLPSQLHWQPILMKLLKERIPSAPLAIQVKKAIQKIRSGKITKGVLPNELHVFGITSLAPIQMDLIQALSDSIDINFFLLTPCRDLWQRCQTRRKNVLTAWDTLQNKLWLLESPRLESNLGKMGAEFQQLLEGSGEYQLGEWKEEDLFAMPSKIAINIGKEATLLEQLQEKLITKDSKVILQRKERDDSIVFLESAGQRRQVQLVRDQILQWLEKDSSLQPRDILIMTPQIEKFAPLVASSFNDTSSTNVELPWIITDKSQEDSPGIIKYVLEMLDIAGTRLTASRLDSLLANPAIQKQQKLNQQNVDHITETLQKTGFRWGLDGQERQGDDEHTLCWCIERWLLGLILPSEPGLAVNGLAPFNEGVTINDIRKWWNILSKICNHLNELRTPKICSEWVEIIKNLIDDFFDDGGDWIWERKKIISALEEWRKTVGDFQSKINSYIIKDILNESLRLESGRFGHRTGKITISALEPMRAIPHKIIILMGLDAKIYPRFKERPGFNLLEHNKMIGDPNQSDQDKYVLLEALMSARDNLMITWNSRDEKTGEYLEASCPIQQWTGYLQSELKDNQFEGLIRKAPSNPLDRKNFIPHNHQPSISCDSRSLQALEWIERGDIDKSFGIALPLRWKDSKTKKNNKNDLLLPWLRNPQITWLEQLEINSREWMSSIEDIDELELNELDRYRLLKQRLLDIDNLNSKGSEDLNYWHKNYHGQGLLPPSAAGIIEAEILSNRWANLNSLLKTLGKIHKNRIKINCENKELIWAGDNLIFISLSQLKSRTVMEGWLSHLNVCASELPLNKTCLISRSETNKQKDKFVISLQWNPLTKEKAISILKELNELSIKGNQECWPIPPESGWAMALAKYKNPKKAEENFKRKWNGDYYSNGENKRSEMQLCFGRDCEPSIFLENDAFQRAFIKLYTPILDNLKDSASK